MVSAAPSEMVFRCASASSRLRASRGCGVAGLRRGGVRARRCRRIRGCGARRETSRAIVCHRCATVRTPAAVDHGMMRAPLPAYRRAVETRRTRRGLRPGAPLRKAADRQTPQPHRGVGSPANATAINVTTRSGSVMLMTASQHPCSPGMLRRSTEYALCSPAAHTHENRPAE